MNLIVDWCYIEIEEMHMNTKQLPLYVFSVIALTACGATNLGSSSVEQVDLSPSLIEAIDNEPSRLLLGSIANMMATPSAAMRTTIDANATIISSQRTPDFQQASLFSFEGNLLLETNTPNQGPFQASLELNLENFEMTTAMSSGGYGLNFTNTTTLDDQAIRIFIEEDFAYVDLDQASEISNLLLSDEYITIPSKFKTPFEVDSEMLNVLPVLNEQDIDAWIEMTLPMMDSLSLMNKSLSGSNLTITYEITQSDLPDIFSNLFLNDLSGVDLSEEDSAFMDDMMTEVLEGITLNRFLISMTMNVLSNQMTNLLIDIDVDTATSFNLNDPIYDPENILADEWGFIEGEDYLIETSNDYEVYLFATMEVFSSPLTIIGPINKESYELIDL